METKNNETGFTLVELAIVMIIIGLLLGGVLKGQEMIANARLKSTITQIKTIQTAYLSFQDMFNALPGDIENPQTRIPNCTAANNCNFGPNGNGNNRIETLISVNPRWNYHALGIEILLVWKHIALANLIGGVNPRFAFSVAGIEYGEGQPASPLGGGYQIYYDLDMTDAAPGNLASGHFLRLDNTSFFLPPVGQAGNSALTAIEASHIDEKIDDGNPNLGDIFANGFGPCKIGNTYNSAVNANNCELFLYLGR